MKKLLIDLWKSKTIRIAIFQALLGLVVAFGTEYPEIGGLVLAKSVLDGIIRNLTTKPIGG